MKCPNCEVQLSENDNYCSECGNSLRSGEQIQSQSDASESSPKRNFRESGAADGVLKPLSGFRRTLSTELVARQTELRTLLRFNGLIEKRTYKQEEVIIHKGEKNRDLIFLTEGLIDITKEEEDGNLVLNEIKPPYILGDIAFLSGIPRTATAVAKTEAKMFVLKYEDFKDLFKKSPGWVQPLLTSFVSGIRSLHYEREKLERKISELKGKIGGKTSTPE